jgi:hypothetical protein
MLSYGSSIPGITTPKYIITVVVVAVGGGGACVLKSEEKSNGNYFFSSFIFSRSNPESRPVKDSLVFIKAPNLNRSS